MNVPAVALTRKRAAELLGVGTETLRYYEKLGLIGEPRRNSSGYRVYAEKDVKAIEHILRIKEYGFTLAEIKTFLEAGGADLRAIKAAIEAKIAEKEALASDALRTKDKLQGYLKGLE